MRRYLLLLISSVVFLTSQLYSQNDSIYFKRLYYTCKTWGFVKYFHSEIANGSMNWDSVLLAKLPLIKDAENNNDFNDILFDMITAPGETALPTEPLPDVPDSLKFNLNVDWFDDDMISSQVRTVLDTIFVRFRPRPHCLVDEYFENGNPKFNIDNEYYIAPGDPEEIKRQLGLFRYWNIINYFYPYKNIIDQNWDETLTEMIPIFCNAETRKKYELAILKLVKRIDDSHGWPYSAFLSDFFGTNYPHFAFETIENEPVITKVDSLIQDLHPGDIIKKIDGFDFNYLKDSLSNFSNGSNAEAIDYQINQYILRGQSGPFNITVENETGDHDVETIRNWSESHYNSFLAETDPVWYDTLIDNSCRFGYVDMARLQPEDVEIMMLQLWNTDAIVFDVRNYPNGTLWYLVNYLFRKPLHISNFTVPDITYPGTLYWQEDTIGDFNSDIYLGKVIILFNLKTISQAEYTCMGLEQYPGSIKIGSTTRAADGNVSQIFFPGGIQTSFTGLGIFYPDYAPTQRIGIIPDIEVNPTIEGIRQGRDEELETAFDCTLVGLNENQTNSDIIGIKIFPNPSSGNFTISYQIKQSSDVLINIYDLTGKLVYTCTIDNARAGQNFKTIKTENLQPGIYFCRVQSNEGSFTTKILNQ